MRDFIVRLIPDERWRGGSREEIAGVRVRAFTPWGAGMRSGLSGLKNFEVLHGDRIYRPFYPDDPSVLSILDSPKDTLFILRQAWVMWISRRSDAKRAAS